MADEEKDDQEEKLEESKDKDADERKQLEEDKKQLEALLKSIKALEEAKKQKSKKQNKRRNLIAIEFGSIFHRNFIINFLGYFMLNLTVIYTVMTVFSFGRFDDLQAVLLFVLTYTVVETLFRTYILMNHFKVVIRTLGFIFYFGYLTIFYILNVYLFPNSVQIFEDVNLVVGVGMFIVFRYLLTKVFRDLMFRG